MIFLTTQTPYAEVFDTPAVGHWLETDTTHQGMYAPNVV